MIKVMAPYSPRELSISRELLPMEVSVNPFDGKSPCPFLQLPCLSFSGSSRPPPLFLQVNISLTPRR